MSSITHDKINRISKLIIAALAVLAVAIVLIVFGLQISEHERAYDMTHDPLIRLSGRNAEYIMICSVIMIIIITSIAFAVIDILAKRALVVGTRGLQLSFILKLMTILFNIGAMVIYMLLADKAATAKVNMAYWIILVLVAFNMWSLTWSGGAKEIEPPEKTSDN